MQQAVKVVESAVAFALPTIQGASQEDLQAAMDTPSTKLAYAATLAASLGLANQEDIIILFIQVLESVAETAARRLQSGNFEVNVNFQLRTSSEQEDVATGFAEKIAKLGDAGSSEQQVFAETLGANLEVAAQEDPAAAVLQEAAQAVKENGVQVKHTETPRIAVNYIAVQDENATNTEVDELAQSDTMSLLMGVVGALAAVFLCAFIAGLCCAWKVVGWLRRKQHQELFRESELNQVASLPQDHNLPPEIFTWDNEGPLPPEVFVHHPRSPTQDAPDLKGETFEVDPDEDEIDEVMEVSLGNLGHFNPDEMEATELEKPEDNLSGSTPDQPVGMQETSSNSSSTMPQEPRALHALVTATEETVSEEVEELEEINLDLHVARF